MTGIILAGGESSRMGENKAFIEFGGERLLDRTITLFRDLFDELILVTNDPRAYLDLDLTIVTDIIPGKGALGGIYSGLFFTRSERAFVAPCDMPFLNRSFIAWMLSQADDCDVLVPAPADGPQPLHAVYSRRCLSAMKKLIDDDRLQIKLLFKRCRTVEIPPRVLKSFDPEGLMFRNINSPEDLDEARRTWSE
ncbi:MAG: molybdenum cofactor guanylyltransferase [Syntrophales bacterium]|jgi:molybdopterin-guanine dinucleotide biosynthesis protein A|nr:molybdenum cofactor guanylyltransferase [Syntrophales bacterium]MCK9528403.1 molybdenum cofactor guanylyltransferase [Syntrophales bacterium]MDX9922672.1 molybdenum cofactor guanylyltransferase [Syntrophales bacterium]